GHGVQRDAGHGADALRGHRSARRRAVPGDPQVASVMAVSRFFVVAKKATTMPEMYRTSSGTAISDWLSGSVPGVMTAAAKKMQTTAYRKNLIMSRWSMSPMRARNHTTTGSWKLAPKPIIIRTEA